VALAEHAGPAEIIGADSRQMRRVLPEMTCAPAPDELRGIPCHLIGVTGWEGDVSVATWLPAAQRVIAELDRRGGRAIVAGGTGLFVRALLDGYALPEAPPDPQVRERRNATPLEQLADDLLERDPVAAEAIDMRNPRRVIRALERLDAGAGGAPGARRGLAHPALRLALDVDPALHARLVEDRARRMFGSGAATAEVEQALAAGVDRERIAGAAIGAAEALAVVAGERTADWAVAEVTRRTLAYAKAQRTFLRGDAEVQWLRRETADVTPAVEAALVLLRQAEPN
jgi:tRNA dimethylallyltransferase